MRRTTLPVIAGVALALLACSRSDFNTPTLLNKPRILAIQAEPPQPALGALPRPCARWCTSRLWVTVGPRA